MTLLGQQIIANYLWDRIHLWNIWITWLHNRLTLQLLISYHIIVIGCTRNLFLSGEGTSHIYLFIFIHFTFVYMLNAICITTNQLEHIQTNLCIHLSYLEGQRNLKIYNKNIKKKKKIRVWQHLQTLANPNVSYGLLCCQQTLAKVCKLCQCILTSPHYTRVHTSSHLLRLTCWVHYNVG